MSTESSRAAEICAKRDDSLAWMDRNYYEEWQEVTRLYRCEEETRLDENGEEDTTLTAVGMPDSFGYVRRAVARGTAQVPNLGFKSESGRGDLIGRTLMSQWDRGGTHRWQKLHFLQAALYGWSVRAWHWATESYPRRRRVDPFQEDSWGEILATYKVDLASIQDPEERSARIADLLASHGRGGNILPVAYNYTAYEGPKSDVLSVADCFPQPGCRSIQESEYFIVERRRNLSWIRATQEYYKSRNPEISNALEELRKKYPTGTQPDYVLGLNYNRGTNFRQYLDRAYDKSQLHNILDSEANTMMWTFIEEHRPGDRPTLSMVAERDVYIGQVDYPYELEGKIAFTEAILIDDISNGIGDSVPRILRGLQKMHNRLVNARADLAYSLVRPLVGTTDRYLWEAGEKQLNRGSGMRLLFMPGGPNSMWMPNEAPAQAAAMSALNEESAYMRMWQAGTGESNVSMGANVDPQQGRTATGARLLAANSDILTADMLTMFGHSIRADAQMMYLLNRSEMTEDFSIDVAPYNRPSDPLQLLTADPYRAEWVKVSPLDFQHDGEIVFEEGSTLAADDERNVIKATTMMQSLGGRQDVNQQRLLADFLMAMGKGRDIQSYLIQPPPPPPPEPVLRSNLSISGKDLAMLPPPLITALLEAAGIGPGQGGAQPPQGMPMPQDSGPPMDQPMLPPPVDGLLAEGMPQGPDSLSDAARGIGPSY